MLRCSCRTYGSFDLQGYIVVVTIFQTSDVMLATHFYRLFCVLFWEVLYTWLHAKHLWFNFLFFLLISPFSFCSFECWERFFRIPIDGRFIVDCPCGLCNYCTGCQLCLEVARAVWKKVHISCVVFTHKINISSFLTVENNILIVPFSSFSLLILYLIEG